MADSSEARLTSREREVLALVGRRLTNTEIAAALVISRRTVESHIAALRRKLGADSRLRLVAAAQTWTPVDVGTHPFPSTSFVGRTADLQHLGEQLARHGWVAVVGMAGCGKSRLVAEYAAAAAGRVVIADLTRSTAASVLVDVAAALGIGPDSRPLEAVAVALRQLGGGEPTLLVLDNVDRVVPAVAALVRALVGRGVAGRYLSTSRAGVAAAPYELVLAPLPGRAAVELFVDRAAAADRPVDPKAAGAVVTLLDGLPLAIELAARRLRQLSLAELVASLGAGPDRGLATAIGGSWTLLDPAQQAALTRLAALPADFDRRLAGVAVVSDAELGDLLDRSLVTVRPGGPDHTTFALLGAVRSFVLTHGAAELVTQVRHDHARTHAELALALERRARTDDSPAAVAEARRLAPDLVAALDWDLNHDPARAMPVARALAACVEQHGADLLTLAAVSRAAEHPAVRRSASPSDLTVLGEALCFGDLRQVEELALLALAKAADSGLESDRLEACHLAAYAAAYTDDIASALERLDEADALADRIGTPWQRASLKQVRGIALRVGTAAQLDEAVLAFDAAQHGFARAGDAMHVNNSRYMMAAVSAITGERLTEALGWASQCGAYAVERGNRHELAHARLTGARLTLRLDEPAEPAAELPHSLLTELHDSVATFTQVGDLRCLHRSCLLLGERGPAVERGGWLERALEVARTARDVANQAAALRALMVHLGSAEEHRALFLALGELEAIIGEPEAAAALPAARRADLAEWRAVVAEGRARGSRWGSGR